MIFFNKIYNGNIMTGHYVHSIGLIFDKTTNYYKFAKNNEKKNITIRFLSIVFFCFFLSAKIFSQTPEEDIFRLENSFENFAKQQDSAYRTFVENKKNEYEEWLKTEKEWIKITLNETNEKEDTSPVKKKNTEKKETIDKKNEKEIKNKKEKRNYNFVKPIHNKYRFSSDFGYRIHPIFKVKKFHYGVDLSCPKGTNIYAVMDGKIVHSAFSKSYGNYVIIKHYDKKKTVYAHMSKRLVKKGDIVKQNDIIGLVGSTGRSTGPHLHFEVIENKKKINPKKFITL